MRESRPATIKLLVSKIYSTFMQITKKISVGLIMRSAVQHYKYHIMLLYIHHGKSNTNPEKKELQGILHLMLHEKWADVRPSDP